MKPDAVLINKPSIDFTTFLGLSYEALGYSLAAKADASPRDLSDAERFLSCLAAIRDPKAPVGLFPSLLAHVSFSIFVAADERDMLDILQCVCRMPFVVAEHASPTSCRSPSLPEPWRSGEMPFTSGSDPLGGDAGAAVLQPDLHPFRGCGLDVWADFRAGIGPGPDVLPGRQEKSVKPSQPVSHALQLSDVKPRTNAPTPGV